MAIKAIESNFIEWILEKKEMGASAGQIFDHIEQSMFGEINMVLGIDNQFGLDLVYAILKKLQNARRIFRNA